jgi:dTDP-4-amino-4,6-dideoxygalactose transaminase
MLGNRPTFADIDPCSLTLDPGAASMAIHKKDQGAACSRCVRAPVRLPQPCGRSRTARALVHSLTARRVWARTATGLPASHLADAVVTSFTTGKSVFAREGGAIITKQHGTLTETDLAHTQHPYRQQRELGLHLWNEFALNARIHPLAAVWANATFEASLPVAQSLAGGMLWVDRSFGTRAV